MRLALLALFFLLPFVPSAQQRCDCDSVFQFVYAKWATVENMEYHSYKKERKMGMYEEAEFDFIVQRSPYKVAGVMTEKRHRLLYNPLQSKNEALYIPSGFPYTNLWLDINGKTFRGLNHYTISNAGCEFIFGIIRNEYHRIPETFHCQYRLGSNGTEIEIAAKTDNYHFKNYQAQEGETVLDIAAKHNVMAYMLIEANEGIDGFQDDCSGLTVRIPSHYGSDIKLVVSANHGMPTRIEVSDKKGLVQRYVYTNYRFNTHLPADYFTEAYLDGLD
ncbi:MAG: hypothetical protein R2813_06655 [Flavobacteriales bacterium]